jgi:hypothetical protein
MEYHSPYEAKRTLLTICENGVDFEVRSVAQVDNELPGFPEDYDSRAEIIMLTFRCTLDFLLF